MGSPKDREASPRPSPPTEKLTAELVAALRGRRSARQLSERLGYRSNVVWEWETGRRKPTATDAMRLAVRCGVDVKASWIGFDGSLRAALEPLDPGSPEHVSTAMRLLAGEMPVATLAREMQCSRFTVSRWMTGRTMPRCDELLAWIHVTTGRLYDFLQGFVPPSELPSAAGPWSQLEVERSFFVDHPEWGALLPLLETRAYAALPRHRSGWIAARLGWTRDEERAALDLCERAGLVVFEGDRYRPTGQVRVDVRRDRAAVKKLQRHWSAEAARRAGTSDEDVCTCYVFPMSERDLTELRERLSRFSEELNERIARTREPERVAMVAVQLVLLDRPGK